MSMRGAARGLWPLLLGLGLLAGMFMMHGISATPSPVHVSAPVVSSFPAQSHARSVLQPAAQGHAEPSKPSESSEASGPFTQTVQAAQTAQTVQTMQAVHGSPGTHGSPGSHDEQRAGLGHGGAHEAGCGAGAVCFALLVAFVLLLVRGRLSGPLLAILPTRPVPRRPRDGRGPALPASIGSPS